MWYSGVSPCPLEKIGLIPGHPHEVAVIAKELTLSSESLDKDWHGVGEHYPAHCRFPKYLLGVWKYLQALGQTQQATAQLGRGQYKCLHH